MGLVVDEETMWSFLANKLLNIGELGLVAGEMFSLA